MNLTDGQEFALTIVGLAASTFAAVLGYLFAHAEARPGKKGAYLLTSFVMFFLALFFVFTLAGPGNA